jgi:HD superfamily phosphodiesterase
VELIGSKEKVSETELQILRLAALYHDAGFIESSKNHEALGADMVRKLLPKHHFDNELVEVICGMILATKLPQSPLTQLEKIICDADLDYLGREDFYEIGNRLFEELKNAEVVDSEREWNLVQKTFLESHKYHTAYGKQNREANKQERLQEIRDKLKKR